MANVSFRMDDTLKMQMEEILDELGLNTTTAMTIFAKTIVREHRIPFELSIDPFYSKQNQNRLYQTISDYENGKSKPVEKKLEELLEMGGNE